MDGRRERVLPTTAGIRPLGRLSPSHRPRSGGGAATRKPPVPERLAMYNVPLAKQERGTGAASSGPGLPDLRRAVPVEVVLGFVPDASPLPVVRLLVGESVGGAALVALVLQEYCERLQREGLGDTPVDTDVEHYELRFLPSEASAGPKPSSKSPKEPVGSSLSLRRVLRPKKRPGSAGRHPPVIRMQLDLCEYLREHMALVHQQAAQAMREAALRREKREWMARAEKLLESTSKEPSDHGVQFAETGPQGLQQPKTNAPKAATSAAAARAA
eukprot:RCo048384